MTFHRDNKVPLLDKLGNSIYDMDMCDRCLGTGYLPKYKSIQSGMCFQCNGVGYMIPYEDSETTEARFTLAQKYGLTVSL